MTLNRLKQLWVWPTLLSFGTALANPVGPQVTQGQATFNQQGNVLSVTNTPNTVINWQGFSINANEVTRFLQQSSDSAVLNRVVGQDPSKIFGALQSNGQVFLINPNGILFGRSSRVDVGGLLASSLNISDHDFIRGKRHFQGTGTSGNITQQGSISTGDGGQILLIAPNVENSGLITAPNGDVVLVAGHSVQLVDSSNPDVRVLVSSPQATALNLGQVIAQSGRVGIFGALVRQAGRVSADSAVVGKNGKILFKASGDTFLEDGSQTSAVGVGRGGDIHALGNRVALLGDAKIDVSGQLGGGSALVGGDYQGNNQAISNAQRVYVSPQANIAANAVAQGDGGKVVVWADQSTQFHGAIQARGAGSMGNGGQVETSGKQHLTVAGATVDASAPHGKNGQWLLDPSDVTIEHGSSGVLNSGVFDPGGPSVIGDSVINAALNGGTDVAILTSSGTGGTGLITVNGTADSGGAVLISNSSGGNRMLTLSTAGAIDIHSGASINGASTSHPLNVTLDAGSGISSSGAITTSGGNVTMLADNLTLGGSIDAGAIGQVRIQPLSSFRDIDLSNTKTGNKLELSNAELNTITAGDLILNSDGNQSVSSAINLANVQHLTLLGSSVAVNSPLAVSPVHGTIFLGGPGGVSVTAGGNLTTSGSNGRITLVGDSISLGGGAGSVNAGAGSVTLSPYSPNSDIAIGVGAVGSAGILSLTESDLKTISTSNVLVIGERGLGWAGNATVIASGLDLTSGAGLTGELAIQSGAINGSLTLDGPLKAPGNVNLVSDNFLSIGSSGSISGTNIAISADRMDLQNGAQSINAGSGITWIRPHSSVWNIDLGSATDDGNSTLELSATELNTFAGTGVLRIGDQANMGDMQISSNIAPTFAGTLSLGAGGHIGQVGTITAPNLAVHALQGVNLYAANQVINLAGAVGDLQNLDYNFTFNNSAGLNIASGLDGYTGVSAAGSASNFIPANPTAVVSLRAGGALTQTSGALLVGKAVYAEGSSVILNESNPVGVLAGKSTGQATTDAFRYTSANGIWLSEVDGYLGVNNGATVPGAVVLTAGNGGISQDANAPVVTPGGLTLVTTGPVNLGATANHIAAVTAQGTGSFLLNSSTGDLAIGAAGAGVSTNNQPISIAVVGGKLQINQNVNAGSASIQLLGDDVALNGAVALTGSNIALVATQGSTGSITTTGASATIGSAASANIKLEADNFDFHLAAPNILASTTNGTIDFVNHSDNRSMTVDLNIGGNYVAKVLAFGNATLADANTTASITLATPITAPNMYIGLFSSGNLTQTAPVVAQGLVVQAASAALDQANQVNLVGANITGPGGAFSLTNTGALTVTNFPGSPGNISGISTTNGNITVDNTGAVIINQPISSGTGAINIVAHSPLTVNAPVTTAGGNITLEAGASGSLGDTLTVTNTGSVGASTGQVLLRAGSNITEQGPVTGALVTRQPNLNPLPTPTLSDCIANPNLSGCSAVLPTLTACIATPSLPGCSVVLPSLAACIATPTLPGCSVILPSLAACIATPTLPGCSVILPSLSTCTSTPTLPGCETILPNLSACIATPTLPGCSVVLPSLTACIATPTLPGCSVVLPNLSACIATPTLTGCSVVLPNLSACIATPTLPGCSVVLPNLSACIATPTLPGCSVVLPNLSACIATPTLPGCSVVQPPTQSTNNQPLAEAISSKVNIIDTPTNQSPSPSASPSAKPTDSKIDEEKKDDKKGEPSKQTVAKDTAAKKDEPTKKLYCN